MNLKKIGIFGGTFDPIHNGHIKIAEIFLKYLNLNKVIFIPTNIPPHKTKLSSTSNSQRLKMCELAIEENPLFCVSNIELLRKGKSYTVDTINEVKKHYKGASFYLIVGADMFTTLLFWKEPYKLLKNVTVCTLPRNDVSYKKLKDYEKNLNRLGAKSIILNIPVINVSSTEIREKIKNKKDVSNLIPKKVNEYIIKNKIYN